MTEDEGKRIIAEKILSLNAQWIAKGKILSIDEIERGQCYDYADELEELLGNLIGVERRETEEWWSDVFIADLNLLRKSGEKLPVFLSEEALSHIIGSATHGWISWRGWHFDARCPEGKRRFLDMPFFREQLERQAQRI